MQPFEIIPLLPAGGYAPQNAYIEVNNLLASTPDILQVDSEDVDAIAAKYRTNVQGMFNEELATLYSKFLRYCLEDKKLVPEEIKRLSHLKRILFLSERKVKSITNSMLTTLYNNELELVLADGVVTDEERLFLKQLSNDIFLDEALAESLYRQAAHSFFNLKVDEALADNRLTPNEETSLYALAESLNVDFTLTINKRLLYERYKMYWLIENGELPVVETGIALEDYEHCHYIMRNVHVNMFERGHPNENLLAFSRRHQVAKAISWRFEPGKLPFIDLTQLELLDIGNVYCNSHRLLFVGRKIQLSIPYGELLKYEIYQNGLELARPKQQNIFFLFDEEVDIMALLLDRLVYNG